MDYQKDKKLRVEIIFEKPGGLELACTERMPLTLLSFFYFWPIDEDFVFKRKLKIIATNYTDLDVSKSNKLLFHRC